MYRAFIALTAIAAWSSVSVGVSDRAIAADIKVLSPGATEGALSEILPAFERASGDKVVIEYGPVGGLAARVMRGEAIDAVILSDAEADRLREQSKTVADTQVVIAKVGIGVFVR